ncbi:MAG: cbb3-type cytochrome oxidase assembly protein CcoS [Flavobacteriales bacterium]
MGILLLMILVSVSLGVIFLVIFIVSVQQGHFDDDESPAVRMLLDDEKKNK